VLGRGAAGCEKLELVNTLVTSARSPPKRSRSSDPGQVQRKANSSISTREQATEGGRWARRTGLRQGERRDQARAEGSTTKVVHVGGAVGRQVATVGQRTFVGTSAPRDREESLRCGGGTSRSASCPSRALPRRLHLCAGCRRRRWTAHADVSAGVARRRQRSRGERSRDEAGFATKPESASTIRRRSRVRIDTAPRVGEVEPSARRPDAVAAATAIARGNRDQSAAASPPASWRPRGSNRRRRRPGPVVQYKQADAKKIAGAVAKESQDA